MADKNDDNSDRHSDISETDQESLQTCSNNSLQNSNECTYTSSNQDLTISYTSSLQSDMSVQINGTSSQDLDLKSHFENNDNSEINYKSNKFSRHSNFGDSKRISKSISGFEADEKDHPQSIKDTVDSNITTDSEKDRQIPVATFKGDGLQSQMGSHVPVANGDGLQSHDDKGSQNTNKNTNARNDSEVTILFNPICQDDLVVCKEKYMENIVEIMEYLCQLLPNTSQVSMSSSESTSKSKDSSESTSKSKDDTSEYKVVRLKTRAFPSQGSALPSADHNCSDDLNMAYLSLLSNISFCPTHACTCQMSRLGRWLTQQ